MPLLTGAELASARAELQAKAMSEIEFETSRKWAARAVVAYDMASTTCDVARLSDAIGCHQEALEHAASASVKWLAQLTAELQTVRDEAFDLFARSLLGAGEPLEE